MPSLLRPAQEARPSELVQRTSAWALAPRRHHATVIRSRASFAWEA